MAAKRAQQKCRTADFSEKRRGCAAKKQLNRKHPYQVLGNPAVFIF